VGWRVAKCIWAKSEGLGPSQAYVFFLFFIVSIFLSYFNFKSNQVLNSKFQIYAQEKSPHDAQFLHSISLFILLLF
jgi:hypothetical protein